MSYRLLICLLLGLAGCRTSYEGRYRYTPTPHEVLLQPEGAEAPIARVLISMQGVRDADEEHGLPLAMDVRLRIENESGGEVAFDARRLSLLDGSLRPFEAPQSAQVIEEPVAAGMTRALALDFPFPLGMRPEDLDLSGLHLSMVVRYPGGEARISSVFERREPEVIYVDRWYADPYPYYGGYRGFYVQYCH